MKVNFKKNVIQNAPVLQLAEREDLKSLQYGFESHGGYQSFFITVFMKNEITVLSSWDRPMATTANK